MGRKKAPTYKKIMKQMKKKKIFGFTLIELLAVIIILGVLMIIAIPSVTEYIQNARKNAYIKTATQYVSGARTKINSAELPLYDTEATYYVPTSCISLEKGGESPFGEIEEGYVVVTYNGNGYEYYFTVRDSEKMGIYLTHEPLLSEESVKTSVDRIATDIAIGDKNKIILFNESCSLNDTIEKTAIDSIPEGSYTDTPPKDNRLISIITEQEAPLDNVASQFVSNKNGIKFSTFASNTNGKGLYIKNNTQNNSNPIYYYRGEVNNNNVIFANYCWKIVRTTETGGIKIIYNGIAKDGKCNNTGAESILTNIKYNNNVNSPADIGYMYGERYTYSVKNGNVVQTGIKFGNDVTYSNGIYTLKDEYVAEGNWETSKENIQEKYHYTCFSNSNQCENVYYIYSKDDMYSAYLFYITLSNGKKIENALDDMTINSTNNYSSTIKEYIDNWYENNLLNYQSFIEDTIWCNDRTVVKKAGWDKDTNINSDTELSFGWYKSGYNYRTSLECSKNDSFTVSNKLGNGKLKYPIGLLTADELILAGHWMYSRETTNYLYIGKSWWSMTPIYFEHPNGSTNNRAYMKVAPTDHYWIESASNSYGVRPAISLKSSVKVSSGDGTINSPYIIE